MNKIVCSAAAILAASSVAYAQPVKQAPCCFEQGYEICNDKYPAAYNAPARIDVQCSWDIFATASFIYWHVDQEAMELAIPVNVSSLFGTMQGEYLVQDFDYKPGFKVGLGVNFGHDNWVGFVEYTWLRQTTETGTATVPSDADFWDVVTWFNFMLHPTTVSSKWRANIDIVDATLSRPFYQGRKLTILPFGGLRGAWIRQNMKVNAFIPAEEETPARTMLSRNHSHNWAVGPRAGLQAHWLLGCGFRFEGDAAASLLYTRFTKITHVETINDITRAVSSFKDYNTVRPMADMGVGIGWGSYFDRQNYHFDLLATYDFNVMWGQNMMPKVSSVSAILGDNSEAADLHLHGLTVTARFDF